MITPAVWKSPYVINSTTVGTQAYGKLAAAPDGSFYAAWVDFSSNANGQTNGKHLSSSGLISGADVPLVSGISGPSLLALAFTGDSKLHIAVTYNTNSLYVRTVDSSLSPVSFNGLFGGGSPFAPAITTFSDGSYFVSYTNQNSASDSDIYGNFVSANGTASPFITLFNDSDLSDHSKLTTLDNGSFVVVYQSQSFGSSTNYDVFFQIRHANGALVKVPTPFNGGGSTLYDGDPDVVALHTGGFAVVWTKGTGTAADVHAVLYDGDGAVVRNDFVVNTTIAGAQGNAHITSMDDGGFLVTWQDFNTGNERAQRFDSSGNHIGQEVIIHNGAVYDSSVITLADGRTAMSFDDHTTGSTYDVYAEIFDTRTNVTGHVTGHDLFGDGSADQLILRTSSNAATSTGGLLTMYDLSATSVLTQIGQVGADWSVAGSGDFNGDGRHDILMQNDIAGARDLYSFTMGATQVTAITKIGSVGLDWQVDGTGDFNGDGFKDILLERFNNGAKELDILGVKNGAVTSINVAGVLTPLTYQVDGIGDLNRDGKDDILVHYDDGTGRHFVALNQGNYTTQSVAVVATIGAEWNAAGMGDFNGDGYADILIHSDTASARDLGILINQAGSGWVFKDLGPLVGKNVQIDGIGDFNHDGTSDISFHYDPTGAARVDAYFQMHNASVADIHTTGSVGHEWIIT